MKTIIPLNGTMGKILDGVVVDLKNIPESMVSRLQLHFSDGASADVSPEELSRIIETAEIDGNEAHEVTSVEVNLDLEKLQMTVETVSVLMSQIIQDELQKHDNYSGN